MMHNVLKPIGKEFVSEVYEMVPAEVKFDTKITSFNPPKTAHGYEATKILIKEQGQQKPIYNRNGLTGDGVHRTQIAMELGRMVYAIDVDPTMSDADFIALCNQDTFGSRSYSPTQLAIQAYKLVKQFNYTDKKAITMTGIKDKNAIGQVRYIMDTKYKVFIHELLQDKEVTIQNDKGDVVYKGKSLKKIRDTIAQMAEQELLEVDNSENVEKLKLDYNTILKTETAKRVFWEHFGNRDLTVEAKQLACNLLNLKFKLKEVNK